MGEWSCCSVHGVVGYGINLCDATRSSSFASALAGSVKALEPFRDKEIKLSGLLKCTSGDHDADRFSRTEELMLIETD